jgi:thioredoxin 1
MSDPRASARGEQLLVVCLCAAWCYVCEDFRATLAGLAQAHADVGFVWVDIEDDSELVGDVDIEDFPTLAVFRGDTPVFFGVTRSTAPAISRTLASLLGSPPRPVAVPEQIAALPRALVGRRREKPA